jgi:hypothetical protein
VLGFVSSDVRYGGENVGTVGRRSFDAVPVVDTTLSCFLIDIEIGEVIVEIDRSSTEVTSEKSSVGGAVQEVAAFYQFLPERI